LDPGQDITDGVHCLNNEKDVLDMMSVFAQNMTLCVLVDQTNFKWNLRPDMISISNTEIEEGE
jgi:hypothetical protein